FVAKLLSRVARPTRGTLRPRDVLVQYGEGPRGEPAGCGKLLRRSWNSMARMSGTSQVHVVSLMQPNKPDRPNRPNEPDWLVFSASCHTACTTYVMRQRTRHGQDHSVSWHAVRYDDRRRCQTSCGAALRHHRCSRTESLARSPSTEYHSTRIGVRSSRRRSNSQSIHPRRINPSRLA